jgi:DNA-binding response OmpR family regulator
VTKPYSTPELLARLRAALRSSGPSRRLVDESVFVVDDLRVDVGHHTLHVGTVWWS